METISTPNTDPKNYITEFKLETVATEWVKLRWTSFLFKPSVLFPQERTWREFCNHCEWNGESISSCMCFVNFLLLTTYSDIKITYAHHACIVPSYCSYCVSFPGPGSACSHHHLPETPLCKPNSICPEGHQLQQVHKELWNLLVFPRIICYATTLHSVHVVLQWKGGSCRNPKGWIQETLPECEWHIPTTL